MSRPGQLWQVEWIDHPPGATEPRAQERRYKTPGRAARQAAAVLAAPDGVADLRGVWVTAGWAGDRLTWQVVDVGNMLDEAVADLAMLDDSEAMGVVEWYRRIAAAWREART